MDDCVLPRLILPQGPLRAENGITTVNTVTPSTNGSIPYFFNVMEELQKKQKREEKRESRSR
jgi:hypothetical protein